MLQMRNGIRNIWRQPLRCLLFVLLLFLTAAFGGLGISILQSANDMVKISDAHYVTRVTFQNEDAGNLSEWDTSGILASPEVIDANHVVRGLGRVEGRPNTSLEDLKGHAIISFRIMDITERQVYGENDIVTIKEIMGQVEDVLYGEIQKPQFFFLNASPELAENWGDSIEEEHTYFAYGTYAYANGVYPIFTIEAPVWAAAEKAGIDLSVLPMLEDTTKTGKPSNFGLWQEFADTMMKTEELYQVYAADKAALLDEFYIRQAEMMDGELAEESTEHTCLVNDRFAKNNGLSVGDELPIQFFYDEAGEPLQIIWGTEEKEPISYRITGIYKYQEELENAIYITRPSEALQQVSDGVALQVQLKNGTAEAFLAKYGNNLPLGMTAVVEDQGYAQAILPMLAMQRQAVFLTVLGVLLGLAVLLFVGRSYYAKSADQLEYLREMGCSRSGILCYLLSGQWFVVAIGAVSGFLAQLFLAEPVMKFLFQRNYLKYTANLHYSQLAEVESFDALEYVGGFQLAGLWFVLFLAVMVTVIAVFQYRDKEKTAVWRKNTSHRAAEKKQIHHSSCRNATLRFALQEFRRNKKQSMVFLMLAFFLTGTFCVLTILQVHQQTSLEKVYDEQEIQGYITGHAMRSKVNSTVKMPNAMPLICGDENPLRIVAELKGALLNEVYMQEMSPEESCIKANDIYQQWKQELLVQQKYIKDFGLGKRMSYEYMGTTDSAPEVPDIPFHTDAYGKDWLLNKLPYMDQIAFADNINYVSSVAKREGAIQYLEGYGDDFLSKSEMICMVSEQFLQENGLSLGDEIRFVVYTDCYAEYFNTRITILDVKIAGSYAGAGTDVYMPIGLLYGSAFLPDQGYELVKETTLQYYRENHPDELYWFYGVDITDILSFFRFTIADNRKLDEVRDFVGEIGFSEKYKANSLRQILLLEDGTFLKEVSSIKRHLEQTDMVLKLLLLLMLGMIFAVSFLSINQVKEEIFLMVELGTPRLKIWLRWLSRYGMAVLGGMLPAAVIGFIAAAILGYRLSVAGLLFVLAEFVGMLSLSVYSAIRRICKGIM